VLVVDDTSVEFAWNVMGGISYFLTEDWVLTGGYRYFSTTDAELDATLVGLGSGSLKAEVGIHELLFGVRYEF
jgi:opacity protein-like surface antigen